MTANWPMPAVMAGSQRTAARVTPGAICFSNSSHVPRKLYSNCTTPVALPPGCARLSTKPEPTGSGTFANTIGTVRLACSNGPTVVPPVASMTSGVRATNSAANLRMSSALPAPQRISIFTLRPSDQPNCRSPCRKAAIMALPCGSSADNPIRTPIRRTRSAGCAWAATDHAAAPPSRAMNSRRLIAAPRASRLNPDSVPSRASRVERYGRSACPHWCSDRSWCVISFVGEAIHHLLGGKAGDGEAADWLQAVVAAMAGEILRSEDGPAQAAGKFLKPRRQVDRRAYAGEIQPVSAPDIAEEHVADMQRQTKAQAAAVGTARPQRGNLIERRSAGGERGGTDRREIAPRADRKDGQQSVAHIFEHFAAVLDDRRHLAIEIAIEQIDQILRRQRVGQHGEATHVGQPDCGVDRLGIAAANV